MRLQFDVRAIRNKLDGRFATTARARHNCCSKKTKKQKNMIISRGWQATWEYQQAERVNHIHTYTHTHKFRSKMHVCPGWRPRHQNMPWPVPHMATLIIGTARLWGKWAVETGWQKGGRVDPDIPVGGKPAEQPVAPSIIWEKSTLANAKKQPLCVRGGRPVTYRPDCYFNMNRAIRYLCVISERCNEYICVAGLCFSCEADQSHLWLLPLADSPAGWFEV